MPPFDRNDTVGRPRLRLVGPADAPSPRTRVATPLHVSPGGDTPAGRLAESAAAESVARENRAAVEMGAGDARWAMAARVAMHIEGGRAGVLRPEVRERLVGSAVRMGLRPFDANLIIAIVQDSARTGHGPLGPMTESRLRLVREPERAPDANAGLWQLAAAAVALGGAIAVLLIAWARGG